MKHRIKTSITAEQGKSNWSYIVIALSVITIVSFLFLILKPQKNNQGISLSPSTNKITPASTVDIAPTAVPKFTSAELAQIPMTTLGGEGTGFTTKYPSILKLTTESLTDKVTKYTLTGKEIIISITVGDELIGKNPNIGIKNFNTGIGGVTGSIYGTSDYYRVDFRNKGIFYTFDCNHIKSIETKDCSIVFDNFELTL